MSFRHCCVPGKFLTVTSIVRCVMKHMTGSVIPVVFLFLVLSVRLVLMVRRRAFLFQEVIPLGRPVIVILFLRKSVNFFQDET